jgi:hypothetical protein
MSSIKSNPKFRTLQTLFFKLLATERQNGAVVALIGTGGYNGWRIMARRCRRWGVDADSNGNDDFASWQPIALRISPVPVRSTADSDFASIAVIPNGTADKRSPIVSGLHAREPLSPICVSLLKAYDTWARRRSFEWDWRGCGSTRGELE